MVLQLDPASAGPASFLPKVNTLYHCEQELVLPDFCPDPRHLQEAQWHAFDVLRALCRYIHRTHHFRKSEALFVSFHSATMGRKVSSSTIGRRLKACISRAYTIQNRPVPGRILPHSTRSASTTAACATCAIVSDICKAAMWTSLNTFIRQYKVHSFASVEALFRFVLQSVCSASVTHKQPSTLPM